MPSLSFSTLSRVCWMNTPCSRSSRKLRGVMGGATVADAPVEVGHVFEDGLKGLVEARQDLQVVLAELLVDLLQLLCVAWVRCGIGRARTRLVVMRLS